MKKLLFIILIVIPGFLFAQNKAQQDLLNGRLLLLVDGKEITVKELFNLNPATVMDAQKLDSLNTNKLYGDRGKAGAMIVITKKFAISTYEQLFSSVSDDLKAYYVNQKGDDSDVNYMINDIDITKDQTKVNKLFSISIDDIASISLSKNDVNSTVVHINIKSKK